MNIIEIPSSEGAPRIFATPKDRASVEGMTDARLTGWRYKKPHSAVHFFGHCAIDVRHANGKASKQFLAAELTKQKKVKIPIRMQWFNTRREANERALLWLCEGHGLAIEISDAPGNLNPARRSALRAQLDGTMRRASWTIHVVVCSAEQPHVRSGGNCLPIHVAKPAEQLTKAPLDFPATVETVCADPLAEPETHALPDDGGVKDAVFHPRQSRSDVLFSRLFNVVQRLATATCKAGVRLFRPDRRQAA